MRAHYYRRYDEEDDEIRYLKVSESGTEIVTVGKGTFDGDCKKTKFPVTIYENDEPVTQQEFQRIFNVSMKNTFSRYNLV